MPTRDAWQEHEDPLPRWLYPGLVIAVFAATLSAFPFGLDPLPEVLVEGGYLAIVGVIALLVRRSTIRALELGTAVFFVGRLVDFADELVFEPEPLVEPYISGALTVIGLAVIARGTYRLLQRRDRRIDQLESQAAELRMKDAAMAAAPVGITVADMDTPDEELIYVNEQFETMTGYSVERAIGTNCRFLQGEETDEQKVAQLRDAINAGESAQVTLRNYRADGTPFWNEVTIAPVAEGAVGERTPLPDGGDGTAPYYVGFQQDVTERKRSQRRLREQRDKLRVLNQIVRHDIRNNLQVVLGRLDMLDTDGDDGAAAVETARRNVDEAIELIQTAGQLSEATLEEHSERRPVALAPALSGQVEETRSSFGAASVTVEGTIPPVDVRADGMLDSVFRNLLENAIRHNDNTTPEVTVAATETDGGTVEVRIRDNGPGIPDDQKAEIFDYGAKGAESTGSGMGTYLVDTLVTEYGGQVRIEDAPDGGAVFVVSLEVVGETESAPTTQ